MTRCNCGSGRRSAHCCHDRDDDGRWAIPAGGVLLALAFVGIIREHGHGALAAVRAGGFTVFGLCTVACAVLAIVRARRRARSRRSSQPWQAAVTRPDRTEIGADDAIPRAIPGSSDRQPLGRPWPAPEARRSLPWRGDPDDRHPW